MYLKIENPGVCPLEGWFILGLSTARSNESAIGQFGTGNKHAVCVLLRHNIEFHIYRGTEKITFFVVPKRMENTNYELVCYHVDNSTKTHQTSMCLEHGALDWTTVDMALRELVSNAVDASPDPSQVIIERVDNIRAKRGTTRVFIRAVPEVVEFYRDIYTRFLVFDERKDQKILRKQHESPALIYRKGVLICKVDDTPSVFNYNCGDNLKIDETRNLSEYAVREQCAELVSSDANALKTLFTRMTSQIPCWESRFYKYDLVSYQQQRKELWQNAWRERFGVNAYASQPCFSAIEDLIKDRKPGAQFISIHSTQWYDAIESMGIPVISHLFSELDKDGLQIIPTTLNTQKTFDKVWGWLDELDLTDAKPKPNVGTFKQPKDQEKVILGKCDLSTNTVYLNEEYDSNEAAMLEEIAHYLSHSTDFTRKFQNILVESFAKTLKFIFE